MLITITNNGLSNGRPTSIGANTISNIQHGSVHVFTLANFTTETSPQYSDPESDPLKYIKITSIISGNGSLKLNNVDVVLGQVIFSGDISSGNLKYESDGSVSSAYLSSFGFDVADTGSSSLSGLPDGVMTLSVLVEANGAPTSVGDGSVTGDWSATIFFTRADFTTNTLPAYADPENDSAESLKILSLPSTGTLRHNGNIVTANQVIPFSEIDSGYFIYLPNTTITSLQQLDFDFSIADSGSGIFIQ